MTEQLFEVDSLGYHIPSPKVKTTLQKAGIYSLWLFADSTCSATEFEKLIPLLISYSAFKLKCK